MSVEIPRVPIVLQFRGFIEIHPRSSSSAETLDGAQVVLATSGTPERNRKKSFVLESWGVPRTKLASVIILLYEY
jgi:hypothetical protein